MNPALEEWINRWWRPLLALGVGLHVTALFGALTEPDSALYATVAKNMAESGDLINLRAYRQDWLDKPHFLFWMTSSFMRLTRINEVGFRFPALVFFMLGVHYTWRLGVLLFNKTVARLAVLLLLVSEHAILSNADVRAEPFLLGLIAAATFHLLSVSLSPQGGERVGVRGWLPHLVAGAAFTAAAMMTKGLFVVVPIGGALISHNWRALLKPRWLVAAVLVALFLTPELAALYLQFDAHPEKVMFGRTGVSGVRFFFWDSQFGRFLNTGPLKGYGDPTYFFHVVLWSFLPWSLWLYMAAASQIRDMWKKLPSPWERRERHAWGAALLTMLVFTASRSQLPHYLNIVFPFFALVVAAWLYRLPAKPSGAPDFIPGKPLLSGYSQFLPSTTEGRVAARVSVLVAAGMPLATIALVILVQPPEVPWVVGGVLGAVVVSFIMFRGFSVEATLGRAFIAAVAVNLALLHSYLPFLLEHQVGRQAAEVANTLPPMQTALVEVESRTFAFGLNQEVINWTADDAKTQTATGSARVLMAASTKTALEERGLKVQLLGTWDYFHVSMPTRAFLNASTRPTVVEPWVLAEVSR